MLYFIDNILLGAKGQLLSISPSGTAEVEENSRLTLTSTYTGADSPTLVYWLKNGNPQFVIWASDCIFFGGGELDPAIYEKTCTNGGMDFTLTFKEVSSTQDGEKWSCRVNTSPQTDSPEVTIKIKGRLFSFGITVSRLKLWSFFFNHLH